MKHLTENEIIDFISMTALDEESLKNAAVVNGHITECETCLQKVKAFQVLYDEFVRMGLNTAAKHIWDDVSKSRKQQKDEDITADRDR